MSLCVCFCLCDRNFMKKSISMGSWVKKNFSQKIFKKLGKHVLNILSDLKKIKNKKRKNKNEKLKKKLKIL